MPSHYLNQCWNIVNFNLRNKLQWNINRNSYIFIQENAFENVVCKISAIMSQPQCVVNTKIYFCWWHWNLAWLLPPVGILMTLGCQCIHVLLVIGLVEYISNSSFAPSQWETALLCNDVSHWLVASQESALEYIPRIMHLVRMFLAATKQLYKWYFPSVCPSVRHTFLTMFPSSYHHETFRSYYQWPT